MIPRNRIGQRELVKGGNGEWIVTKDRTVDIALLDRFGAPLQPAKPAKGTATPKAKPEPKVPVPKDAVVMGKWRVQYLDVTLPNPETGKPERRRRVTVSHEAWGEGVVVTIKVSKRGDNTNFRMIFPGDQKSPLMGRTLAGKTFGERFGIEVALYILGMIG